MNKPPKIELWQQGVLTTPTHQWVLEVWDVSISPLGALYRLRTRDGSIYFHWHSSEPHRIEQLEYPNNIVHRDIKWFPFN